jgi:hypothetical protein
LFILKKAPTIAAFCSSSHTACNSGGLFLQFIHRNLLVEPEPTMKTFSPSPLKLAALMLSIGISIGLMDAISTGFTSQQAKTQCVMELPMVTVHGKRLTSEDAVVADVNASAESALPANTQL